MLTHLVLMRGVKLSGQIRLAVLIPVPNDCPGRHWPGLLLLLVLLLCVLRIKAEGEAGSEEEGGYTAPTAPLQCDWENAVLSPPKA